MTVVKKKVVSVVDRSCLSSDKLTGDPACSCGMPQLSAYEFHYYLKARPKREFLSSVATWNIYQAQALVCDAWLTLNMLC